MSSIVTIGRITTSLRYLRLGILFIMYCIIKVKIYIPIHYTNKYIILSSRCYSTQTTCRVVPKSLHMIFFKVLPELIFLGVIRHFLVLANITTEVLPVTLHSLDFRPANLFNLTQFKLVRKSKLKWTESLMVTNNPKLDPTKVRHTKLLN